MTDAELDALVNLAEEFVTATWHMLDNSETSGPIEDPTIAVWGPDYDEVSALLDRCEGLPSGSTEHMTAGGLLAANIKASITALRSQLAAETDRADRAEAERAAQIELSARLLDDWAANLRDLKIYGTPAIVETCAGMIRAQPHDRTALDAAIRAAKVEAWREAADKLKGQGYNTAVRQILALIGEGV